MHPGHAPAGRIRLPGDIPLRQIAARRLPRFEPGGPVSEARRSQFDRPPPAAQHPPAIEALPASKIGEGRFRRLRRPASRALWFGEGDLPTPSFIAIAAIAALRDGQTFYTTSAGFRRCAGTIAEYLTRLHEKPVGASASWSPARA